MARYGGDYFSRGRLQGAPANDRGYEAMAGFRGRLERGDPGYGGDYRGAGGMRGGYDRDFGGRDRLRQGGRGPGFGASGAFGGERMGRGSASNRPRFGRESGPSGSSRGQAGRPFRDAWNYDPELRRGPDFRGR